ncbi:hypothetical protein ScPMuIL_003085 [Solemya velum]
MLSIQHGNLAAVVAYLTEAVDPTTPSSRLGAKTEHLSRTLTKMVARFVLLLSLVCMCMSFIVGFSLHSNQDTLVKEATSKILDRLEERGRNTQTRNTKTPNELTSSFISQADVDGDGQLDSAEIMRYYTDIGGMDPSVAEDIAAGIFLVIDKDHSGKLRSEELVTWIEENGQEWWFE